MREHRHRDPAPLELAMVDGEVSSGLQALVTELLHKNPAERPGSALEVRDRLRRFAGGVEGSSGGSIRAGCELEMSARPEERGELKDFRPPLIGREKTKEFLAGLLDEALGQENPAFFRPRGQPLESRRRADTSGKFIGSSRCPSQLTDSAPGRRGTPRACGHSRGSDSGRSSEFDAGSRGE